MEKYSEIAAVRDKRLDVVQLVQDQREVVARLEPSTLNENWLPKLSRLAERVQSDSFKVLVLGQFNRGKSTFINAMLSEKVLPTYATPTTAVINEVKFDEEKYAVLYPRDPAKEAQRISVDELVNFVVVDAEDELKPNPFAKAEVFWPLELCKSGVELIDSPGLNEDPDRELITVNYLEDADAVIFVLDASQLLTMTERNFIQLFVQPLGHEDAFFIVNKVGLVPPDELPAVERRARKMLEPFVKYDQRVFFIDSRVALDAKEAGDADQLQDSNLPLVERSIEHFLSTQRGRTKVLVPARELERCISDTQKFIREQKDLLSRNLSELEETFARNQPPLERLKTRIERIEVSTGKQVDVISEQVRDSARRFVQQLAHDLPERAVNLQTEARITVNPFRQKTASGELVNELTERLAGVMQEELIKWRDGPYAELLAQSIRGMEDDLRQDLKDFATELEHVRLDMRLASDSAPDTGKSFEAVLSSSFGLTDEMMPGTPEGLRGLARVAVPKAAALAIAGLTLVFVPVLWIPAGIAALAIWGAGGDFKGQRDRVTDRMKRQVGQEAAKTLLGNEDDFVRAINEVSRAELVRAQSSLLEELHLRVDGLETLLKEAVEVRRKGVSEAEAEQAKLRDCLGQVEKISVQVGRVIDEILNIAESSPAITVSSEEEEEEEQASRIRGEVDEPIDLASS